MSKKFLGLIAVLLISIGVLAFNTYYKTESLIKNGVTTTAVIEKISTNRIDNKFSPTVENIHVEYSFTIDSKQYTKNQEVSKHEHDLYFEKIRKVGDSMIILYDAEKPTNSRIQKISER